MINEIPVRERAEEKKLKRKKTMTMREEKSNKWLNNIQHFMWEIERSFVCLLAVARAHKSPVNQAVSQPVNVELFLVPKTKSPLQMAMETTRNVTQY